jgi:hypothetical protein
MSDMVEHVGRILFRQARGQPCPPFSQNWRDYEADAREIIAVMREPTADTVERVARAICRVEEPDFDPNADDRGREPALWTNYIEHARAAIAAMREPTDAR